VLNKIISFLRNKDEKWLFLIHYAEHLVPANSMGISAAAVPGQIQATELLHMLSFDDSIASGPSRVAIISYGEMPSDLITRSNGYRMIQINLPCNEERLAFIKFLLEKKLFSGLEKKLSPQNLANITAGMPLIEIEKLFRAAAHLKSSVCRNQVKIAKARAIRQFTGDLLEVSEPEETLDQVAGLRHVKEFIIRLAPQLKESQKGVPQSILLNGIPGCGKSCVVSALANFLGWVLIQFRTIRGPYVGQSEQQLEHVIRVAEQFEPSIIFFDEIDQFIGQRGTGASGDSGTSERMLARILSWIGSMKHRGKILFIGASNRPDLLDPAMMDRFRVSIPVLYPSKHDIFELLPILLKRFDRKFSKEVRSEKVAEVLAAILPTGRSLQEILIQAGLRADNEKGKIGSPIGMQHLMQAADDYLPCEDPLEMEFIALTSLAMCSGNSFLPWMGIDGLRVDSEIPENLIADKIVDAETGKLDRIMLHQKIRELGQARQFARAIR
jgi:SpoVK/Ycf46/Vps4 family AAA+-type ATPase